MVNERLIKMEVEGPLEAVGGGAEADITSKLHGVLVEELTPIQSTLQVGFYQLK